MNLAERIRTARKERQLSQEALAHRAGLSLRAFRSLERGEAVDPHYSTLSGIATALDMSVAELVGEPEFAGKGEAPAEEAGPPLVKDSAARMTFKTTIKAKPERVEVEEILRDLFRRVRQGEDDDVLAHEGQQEIERVYAA